MLGCVFFFILFAWWNRNSSYKKVVSLGAGVVLGCFFLSLLEQFAWCHCFAIRSLPFSLASAAWRIWCATLGSMENLLLKNGCMSKDYRFYTIVGDMLKYCWWTKSCTTKDEDYPIIYRVLTIPGGADFLSINSIEDKLLYLLGSFASCVPSLKSRLQETSGIGITGTCFQMQSCKLKQYQISMILNTYVLWHLTGLSSWIRGDIYALHTLTYICFCCSL